MTNRIVPGQISVHAADNKDRPGKGSSRRVALAALPRVALWVLLVAMGPMLAGCTNRLDAAIIMLTQSNKTERQEMIEEGNADFLALLGYNGLYTSQEELSALVTDEESFLRYVVAPYLVDHPEITYERFRAPEGLEVSREEFAAYRYQAFVWLEELKARPENRELVERVALFEKRANWPLQKLDQDRVFALIRDEAALEAFLTDDANAKRWLESHAGYEPVYDPRYPLLGPALIGVTPGTGS